MKEFGYEKQYDVIVAGGGVSGTVAAIAAGRLGADVLILEEGAYLGGALTGCGVGPMMTFHAGEKQVIRGIMEEIVERLKNDGYSTGHIYDTMQYIKCDVSTICMGMAASMGAFLLAAGAKGKRFALPNAEIMIHQPSGGAQGQATDIQIQAERILQMKKSLNTILAERTGQTYETIARDTERDNFMTAQQAMEYGLIDKVIETKSK